MAKITHKIREVPDEICRSCSQCWEEECRAYSTPHSIAEAQHRQTFGMPLPCEVKK
jgi:hypothetical protein